MRWIQHSMGLLSIVLALLLALGTAALAAEPADTVRAHFLEISAEDYSGADQYFSAAFRRAFKGDFAAMDRYYIMRRAQLRSGYDILGTEMLTDRNRETARVTVEFRDPAPDSLVLIAERMHYYLVREKADEHSPQRDHDGMAWRIDIFDALAFDTLAEARRRPYLYTREAWPEDEGRELRAQQGLYRVQQALESFRRVTGQYPLRLLGSNNRRDELISGKYLPEQYPLCGFADRPMESVEFGIRSSGDFSYYSVDSDGDGRPDSYWLLLHGKVPGSALFAGRDVILILAGGYRAEQDALAREFAQWWQIQRGENVQPGPALGENWNATARSPELPEVQPEPGAPEESALDNPPLVLDSPALPEELLAPGTPPAAALPETLPAGMADVLNAQAPPALGGPATGTTDSSGAAGASAGSPADNVAAEGTEQQETATAPVSRALPVPQIELIVHSWGFK